MTLMNLKSPKQFKFLENTVLLGSKLATAKSAMEIGLSYYQVSISSALSAERGENKLSKIMEENSKLNFFVKLY